MPKLNYPLKKYRKAVEVIAEEKGIARINVVPNKGSAVRFEVFREVTDSVPASMWVIHHSHERKQIVWSKDNYRKAAEHLGCTLEEFIQKIESL